MYLQKILYSSRDDLEVARDLLQKAHRHLTESEHDYRVRLACW
jgi:hypothetical protein